MGATTFEQLKLVVRSKRALATDVVELLLEREGGGRLPDWAPGAHITLELPTGPRQYSLCGDRWDAGTYRVAVLRDAAGRGGSRYIHHDLRPGDQMIAHNPRNLFPVVPSQHYVFLAAGIGITPILPMLYQASIIGARWSLVYSGRSRHRMPFLDVLANHGEHVRLAVSDEGGRIDVTAHVADLDPDTTIYACGPPEFVAAAEAGAAHRPDVLRSESFRADTSTHGPATPFTTILERTGVTVHVSAGDSLLAAIEEAGVPLLSSCREGTCGTCAARVLGGDVDHRDAILSPEERLRADVMYPCVSRAAGTELRLDV